jgi:hypothetical protein
MLEPSLTPYRQLATEVFGQSPSRLAPKSIMDLESIIEGAARAFDCRYKTVTGDNGKLHYNYQTLAAKKFDVVAMSEAISCSGVVLLLALWIEANVAGTHQFLFYLGHDGGPANVYGPDAHVKLRIRSLFEGAKDTVTTHVHFMKKTGLSLTHGEFDHPPKQLESIESFYSDRLSTYLAVLPAATY